MILTKNRRFFRFLAVKKRSFLAPGRVFFAADSGNVKTDVVRRCVKKLLVSGAAWFLKFFHDFDQKQAFLQFSHIKKRPFLAPSRVFFAADSGNAKTNAVRRCVKKLLVSGAAWFWSFFEFGLA